MQFNPARPSPSDAVTRARRGIENDWLKLREQEPRISRLVLNEAEAIAWQTGWPDLVFPALAEEKLQALSAWHRAQKALYACSSGSSATPPRCHAQQVCFRTMDGLAWRLAAVSAGPGTRALQD